MWRRGESERSPGPEPGPEPERRDSRSRARGASRQGRERAAALALRGVLLLSVAAGAGCQSGALAELARLLERAPGTAAPPERPPAGPPDPATLTGPARLLRGANVMTAAGPTLEGADLLIRGTRIAAVGRGLSAPPGAEIVDVRGRWITPGLIDPHSHLGVYPVPSVPPHADGNERSGPFQPALRAAEGFWPQDPAIRTAAAGGVTTIHVLPGSANLIGGGGATLYLRPARTVDEMRVPGAPPTMKLACGENPKRVYGERNAAPTTRMAEVALLRQQLENARTYDPEPGESRDFEKEALRGVLRGETLIQNHCYRADEMAVRLALFEEFGVTPRAFHHATEAYKIRDRLARADVGAVVWADWWGNKFEMLDAVPAGTALLDAAGVRVALHSDSPDDIQRMNQVAALALAAGLRAGIDVDRDRAIRWVTAHPAWILGIERDHGTLEPGKLANLAIWSGDPFSVYTRADAVYVEGSLVYDRTNPALFPPSDFELGIRVEP